jgi:hypothetical protein
MKIDQFSVAKLGYPPTDVYANITRHLFLLSSVHKRESMREKSRPNYQINVLTAQLHRRRLLRKTRCPVHASS